MIKIAGIEVQNSPNNREDLGNLIMGEMHSDKMYMLKTPINVYGESIEELQKYAQNVKEIDSAYDTMFVYDVDDEDYGRHYLKRIEL